MNSRRTPQRDLFQLNHPYDDLLPSIDEERLYTAEEAAPILGLRSSTSVRNRCHSGEIRASNLGTAEYAIFRIPGRELKRYLLRGARTMSE